MVYAYQNCTLSADSVTTAKNNGFITNMYLTWNILGIPEIESLPKEDLIIRYNGVDYNWSEATTNNNPTGGPIILGYIYNWNRSTPQHYELVDVFDPGYGYQMYAYYYCSLYYPVLGQMGGNPGEPGDNKPEPIPLKEQDLKPGQGNNGTNWNVLLQFKEPGGAFDNVIFGEKTVALDGQDVFDIPKSLSSFPPSIRAWFTTDSADPYDEIWEEFKQSPDKYKTWDLVIQWTPSDYSSSTPITISWDSEIFLITEYTSVTLFDVVNNITVADMLDESSYTFICPALSLQNYKIICTITQPRSNPTNSLTEDGANNVSQNNKQPSINLLKRSVN